MSSAFAQRRERFMSQLGDAVAIVPANREVTRSADTNFPFRQDSYFYYLTGFTEPDAVAVFSPKHAEHQFVLFVRERNKEREIWDGRRYGPEGAVSEFGADAAFNLSELEETLPSLLANTDVLYHEFTRDVDFDQKLMTLLRRIRHIGRRTGDSAPRTFRDPGFVLDSMRLFKDADGIAAMRKAGQIAKDAHRHGMRVTKPGMNEAILQAEMEHACRMGGSPGQSYNSIVAGGDNANILHYVENNMELKDGDLVLVDLGCEVDYFASDITRTWPVNGKFTDAQREIYDMVLKAQEAAFALAKPGNTIRELHEASSLSLATSLVEKGILKGDPETHMRVCIGDDTETKFEDGEPMLKDFFMHGTGHWIGLDVHDVGAYRRGDAWTKLEPGMAFTVEPGLYFSLDNERAPEEWRGIGVRIEDDLLITPDGFENLTAGLPRTVEEIEACCAEG